MIEKFDFTINDRPLLKDIIQFHKKYKYILMIKENSNTKA